MSSENLSQIRWGVQPNNKATRTLTALAVLGAIAQSGCDSGSYGSDVGANTNVPPTARAQVLNGGNTSTFREGSEVLLTGKDSEDSDGPILDWNWSQTAGPAVLLVESNATTVSFTAPDVNASTTLTFELTVTDSYQETDQAPVDVTVLPAQDADRFLTLALRSTETPRNTFSIIPALATGTGVDQPFTLSVQAYLIYPTLGSAADCRTEALPQTPALPPNVGACSIALLQDLTPAELQGGGTATSGFWPASAPIEQPTDDDGRIDAVSNPRFSFRVPRLDVARFNQQFLPDRRNETMDASSVDEAVIALRIELAADNPTVAGALIGAAAPSSVDSKGIFLSSGNDGSGAPITAWVDLEQILRNIVQRESNLTAEVYYQAVDPGGNRTTLNDWLCLAGFAEVSGCGPLEPDETTRIVNLRPEAKSGGSGPSEEFAHAVYLNNFDLGFGRDMFTRIDSTTGNVYSFVRNHRTLEAAIRNGEPVVTVVMEYSPPEDALGMPLPDANSFTKFFTYTPNGTGDSARVNTLNFDGRGELATPGNCVACHGGADPAGGTGTADNEILLVQGGLDSAGQLCDDASQDPVCFAYPDNGDLQATFLPWDVDSLLFVDTDPAITNAPEQFDGQSLQSELEALAPSVGLNAGLGRSQQNDQLTRLNEAALATYVQNTERAASGIGLLDHWYSALDITAFPPLLGGSFCDAVDCGSEAPADWQDGVMPANADEPNDPGSGQLYFDVYARNCRMCHTNILDETLRFDSYSNFINALSCGSPETCGGGVFTRGVMPAARLTMDRFWASFDGSSETAGDVLGAHLAAVGRLAAEPTPPAAAALITIPPSVSNIDGQTQVVSRYSTVRLSGATSDFANDFQWTPGAGFPSPGPTLVGANQDELAFTPDQPGDYPVTLTINDNETASVTIQVENYVPVVADDQQTAEPGGPSVSIDFLANDVFQRAACAPTCPEDLTLDESPDLPLTISLAFVSAEDPDDPDGTFELLPGNPCTLENSDGGCTDDRLLFTPAAMVFDTYSDTFEYSVTDIDGDVSAIGTITIDALQELVAIPTIPEVTSDIPADLNLTVTGGAQANGGDRYTVSLQTGPSLGSISGLALTNNGSAPFTYTSNPFATGDESFTLRVSDSDATSVDVNFSFQVQPQVRFSSGEPTELTIIRIVRNQSPATSASCATSSCHTPASSPADHPWFNPLLQVTEAWNEVRRAVTVLGDGSIDVAGSKILCVPTGTCLPTNGTPHDGLTGLYPQADEDAVRRWLQEGAQNN